MFNLGYKEVVLNSAAGVKWVDIDGVETAVIANVDAVVIEGYGAFPPVVPETKITPPARAIQEEKTWTVVAPSMPTDAWGGAQTLAIGDVIEVEVKIRSLRNVGSIARDFIVDGKSIIFQSIPLAAITAAGIATAIQAGYELFMGNATSTGRFATDERYFTLAASGDTVVTTVEKGLEHVFIKSVGIKVVKSGGLPFTMLALEAGAVEGSVGTGLGKFIEESRRMGTAENVMPYAQSHGGNSQGIDVRGMYTTYFFTAIDDSSPKSGWASHEYVDHSYVNAAMESKERKYVIYAWTELAADGQVIPNDLNALLDVLVPPQT